MHHANTQSNIYTKKKNTGKCFVPPPLSVALSGSFRSETHIDTAGQLWVQSAAPGHWWREEGRCEWMKEWMNERKVTYLQGSEQVSFNGAFPFQSSGWTHTHTCTHTPAHSDCRQAFLYRMTNIAMLLIYNKYALLFYVCFLSRFTDLLKSPESLWLSGCFYDLRPLCRLFFVKSDIYRKVKLPPTVAFDFPLIKIEVNKEIRFHIQWFLHFV